MIRSACLIKPWHGKALSSRVKSSEEEHREIQREQSEQAPRGEGEHERQKDAGKAKGHHHKKKSIIRIKMTNPTHPHTHTHVTFEDHLCKFVSYPIILAFC